MSQAIPGSINATFGTTAPTGERASASGAFTLPTPKRGPWTANKLEGTAASRSLPGSAASASMKFGTLRATRRESPFSARTMST